MSHEPLNRFLGGSPGNVIVRLLFLSLAVGAVMSWWGITPIYLYDNLNIIIQSLIHEGFASLRNLGIWGLYGAMIVVPIWLVLRIIRSSSS